MDFGDLLRYAKKNSDAVTKEVGQGKYYSTKYSPPKKQSKESKQLSSNIQKFLQKKEAEEAEKKRLERQKLNDLLAKRDEKSKNKIRKMLKVTKSANKSVLEDAKDYEGAIDGHEAGEGQGDDYGYVSTEANAFYDKYIEKVRDVQEDKGFTPSRPQSLKDLSGTKERVKAAITREREEAKGNTRQKSSTSTLPSSATKSKESSVARSYSTSKTLYDPNAEKLEEERKKRQEEEQRRAKIKRPAQPPPMDFQALLRLLKRNSTSPWFLRWRKKRNQSVCCRPVRNASWKSASGNRSSAPSVSRCAKVKARRLRNPSPIAWSLTDASPSLIKPSQPMHQVIVLKNQLPHSQRKAARAPPVYPVPIPIPPPVAVLSRAQGPLLNQLN
nr:RE64245p [Drosophila melanogaster]